MRLKQTMEKTVQAFNILSDYLNVLIADVNAVVQDLQRQQAQLTNEERTSESPTTTASADAVQSSPSAQ